MKLLTDTSPEAERVLIDVYRRMPVGQKWLMLGKSFQTAKMLHAAGVRFRNPQAASQEIHSKWLELHFGSRVPSRTRSPAMDPAMENLRVFREVVAVLNSFDIPYALGGSMASSIFGVDRYTRDADITVEPFPGKEALLAGSFGSEYYVSLPAVQEAVRNRSTFNIINTAIGFKVDVFVRRNQEFEKSAMARRVSLELPDSPGQPLFFHSPEDVILFKLTWYRKGNEISDQQWSDVLGVLKVQGNQLDFDYLERWAKELKIDDLLARAREQANQ
jgi:hypothetical protein